MAIGVLDAAREMGVAVPAQLSVVGFDDISSAGHVRPALTTVARPYEQMGALAVQQMVETVRAPVGAPPARQLDLPTHLVVRESTGPVSAGQAVAHELAGAGLGSGQTTLTGRSGRR
jgi:LacI family transcriptional regulator